MISSTLTSWALLIWTALKDQGYDPLPLFKAAGADPSKLGDGQARYDQACMDKLWAGAVKLTGDPDIGVRVGNYWSPTTFHALGFSWLASAHLIDGLNRAVRYAKVINNSLTVELVPMGANYFFIIDTLRAREVHPVAVDAGLSASVKMCRSLLGETFSPVELSLRRDYRAPGCLESYAGCGANYGQDYNGVLLNMQMAQMELPSGNAELALLNDNAAALYLQKISKEDVVGQVQRMLTKLLPTGSVTEVAVADSLNLNLRTMQRKLNERGKTFRDVLNKTREDLALNYIRNSKLSLTEIAYLLGFADQANFTRAFKRWTGSSPSDFRKSLTLAHAAAL